MNRPIPPKPDNIRTINDGGVSSWGWIDHRIEWFMDDMTQEEILLYFFLAASCDKNGCSWYSSRHIQKLLKIGPATLIRARQMLEERGLISTRKDELSQRTIYQVLPLPIQENERIQIPMKRKVTKNPTSKTKDKEPVPAKTEEHSREIGLKYLEDIRGKLGNF